MLAPQTLRVLRILHRWAGLAMAAFIILVGLTGSLLAFYWELEALLSPSQFVEPHAGAIALDAGELANLALQREPRAYVTEVYLPQPGRAEIRVAPRPLSTNSTLAFDEILLDPFTGRELGRRTWGAISQGRQNLMPFIYEFHYSLALGDTGVWLLGIIALVWTLDCFTGLLITLPARRTRRTSRRSFWARWKKAWKIQWRTSRWRLNFDLHRAGSLWLWLVLLVFAWSSVYMNLWDTVYTRVTASVMEFHPPWVELAQRKACADIPVRDWQEVDDTAIRLMQTEATVTGFSSLRPVSLRYYANYCAYRYRILSTLDVSDRLGHTDLYFDAANNQVLLRDYPSGQYTGNTVTNWLFALHTAHVFGLPYKLFVSVLGVALAVISATGVLIWWKRRSAHARYR